MATVETPSRHRSLGSRSQRRFTWRRVAIVGFGAVVLTGLTLSVGLSAIAADRSPRTAIRMNPWSSEGLANTGMQRIEAGEKAGLVEARRLSERAILLNPVSAAGVRNLAYLAEIDRNYGRAAQLAGYAERLSRRDSLTQVLLIEQRVRAGDVAGALKHYDIALKTSAMAHALLLPILVNSIDNVDMRTPVARLLAARPVWRVNFIRGLQSSPALHVAAVDLALRLDALRSPLSQAERDSLGGALIAAGRFDAVAALYHRRSDPELVRFSAFNGPEDESPFNWRLSSNYDFGADRARDGLAVFAQGDRGGEVARQLLLLKPGRYNLSSAADGNAPPPGGAPYWQVSCARDGTVAGVVELKPTKGAHENVGAFTVPANCPAQWLSLAVRPTNRPTAYEARVIRVAIRPIG